MRPSWGWCCRLAPGPTVIALALVACTEPRDQQVSADDAGARETEPPAGPADARPTGPPPADAAPPVDTAPAPAGTDAPVSPPDAPDPCAGVSCVFQNADSACDPGTGRCSTPRCRDGYGDCDGTPGCEARLDTSQRCGSCGQACTEGFVCGPLRSCGCGSERMLCGDGCADLQTDPKNCGACLHECVGACAAGKCACVATGRANLFRNGGFDSNIGDMHPFDPTQLEVTWQQQDASECPGSGAARIRLLAQANTGAQVCVNGVQGNTSYDVGVMIKMSDGVPASRFIAVVWSSQPDCTFGMNSEYFDDVADPGTYWHLSRKTLRSPSYATSVVLQLSLVGDAGSEGFFDDAFITPTPGGFLD